MKPNVFIDRIQRLDLPPWGPTVPIRLQGGATALVDMTRPNAAGFCVLLRDLQQQGELLYLEVDPTTGVLERVLLPLVTRVASVAQRSVAGSYEVLLKECPARFFVRRLNPDSKKMLAALRASVKNSEPVLVTYTLDELEIIDVRRPVLPEWAGAGTIGLAGPTTPVNPATAPVAPTPITPIQARLAFDLVSLGNCSPFLALPPCIPFLFPKYGCEARAHDMCRILRVAGYQPSKIWNFGDLSVRTKNDVKCVVTWTYHVAVALLVDTGSVSEPWILDPALFDSDPVDQDSWTGAQDDPNSQIHYSDADVFLLTETEEGVVQAHEDKDLAQTHFWLKKCRNALRIRTFQYGPPPYPCP